MERRRVLTTSMSWDYQCEEEIPDFNYEPLRDGELGQINGGISFSQVIQQLEKLNVTRAERTPKSTVEKYINSGQKLPSSISEVFLPTLDTKHDLRHGSATCCSYLGSSSLQGQLQRQQPGLKCNKPHGFWLHHPKRKYLCTPRSNQGDGSDMAQSEIPLIITPAVVTRSRGLSDRRGDGRGTGSMVSSSYCLTANKFEGFGAGTSSGSSTGQSSSSLFTDFPSDDSDLSDQEKASVTAHEWVTPVELDLRPEPFHKDDPNNYLESAEDQSSYTEVLPAPLKILDPTQNLLNREDWERRQSLQRLDPSLFAFASRLAEMERMQAATFLKERTKAGRCRPVTAISMTRSTARMRKADFFGCHPESPVPGIEPEGGCPSILSGLADLALSHTSMARRRLKTACVPSKQSHNARRSTVNPTQPHSSRVSRTSFLSGHSAREGLLLKAIPSHKVNRTKGSKKVTSRPKKRTSCSTRKKTTGPDIKL